MIFAVSDVVWQAVIAAVLAVILAWMSQRATRQATAAALAADKVRVELARESAKVRTAIDGTNHKLDGVAEQIHEVHVATNSMKDALVSATEKEAFARGGKEERERAEKRNGK